MFGAELLLRFGALDVDALVRALRDGRAVHNSDLLLRIGNARVVFEYDGSYYHNEQRVGGDLDKTRKLLASTACDYVVRVRVKGAARLLPEIASPRCLVVYTTSSKACAVADEVCASLPGHLCPKRTWLGSNAPDPAEVACATLRRLDQDYDDAILRLTGYVGKHNLVQFLSCDGVASKLQDPDFWALLETLRTDWGIDKKNLCTFMCSGVAAKIGDPALGAFLETLRTDWGFDKKNLCAFMCGGVAAKIGDPAFAAALRTLLQTYGVPRVARLTSDSLATRLVPAWARHMVLATEHLDGLGLDGFALWRRCVGNNAVGSGRALERSASDNGDH